MNRTSMRKTAIALVASGALLVASVGSSLAGVITTTTGITAGALALTNPSTATITATLDGTDQVAAGNLGSNRVKDATGSGQGWNVQLSGTVFTAAGGRTLPDDALSVTGVAATRVAGRVPTNSISYSAPVTVPLGSSATPIKVYNAAAGSGMGTFDLLPSVALAIPADTYAGSYASNVTISLVAGP